MNQTGYKIALGWLHPAPDAYEKHADSKQKSVNRTTESTGGRHLITRRVVLLLLRK